MRINLNHGKYRYVEDVDAVFNMAVSAGATVTMPLMDAFWGDRHGSLVEPFGHRCRWPRTKKTFPMRR